MDDACDIWVRAWDIFTDEVQYDTTKSNPGIALLFQYMEACYVTIGRSVKLGMKPMAIFSW